MNVLFDLDGTLTDSRDGIVASVAHALTTLGQPVPATLELQRLIGTPLRDKFKQLLPAGDPRVEEAVDAYRERFAAVGMFENSVYAGVPEMLTALSGLGVRMFIATSKPRLFAEKILDHFGLARHFEAVYGSELNGERSNKGELIAHILQQASLYVADTVMIGDRHHDVRGALQNRVAPVAVLWGYGSRDELVTAGATQLAERPQDIAGFCRLGFADSAQPTA